MSPGERTVELFYYFFPMVADGPFPLFSSPSSRTIDCVNSLLFYIQPSKLHTPWRACFIHIPSDLFFSCMLFIFIQSSKQLIGTLMLLASLRNDGFAVLLNCCQ